MYVCTAMREGMSGAPVTAAAMYVAKEGGFGLFLLAQQEMVTGQLTYSAKDCGDVTGAHDDADHGVFYPDVAAHLRDGRQNEVVVGHVQSRVDAIQKQACRGGNGILLCGSRLKDTRLQAASLNHQMVAAGGSIVSFTRSDFFLERLHECASDQALQGHTAHILGKVSALL